MGQRLPATRPLRANGLPPDTLWRRTAVVFACSTVFDLMAWSQLQAFTPLFLRSEFGLPPDEVARWTGLLTASQLVLALPLSLFWGALADRFGRKPVIVRSYVVSAVCYFMFAAAGSVEAMLLARFLFGLAFGSQAVMAAAQADVTPERRLATAMSFVQMMLPVGLALGPLIGGALIDAVGLRTLFALGGGSLIVAALLVLFAFEDRTPRDHAPLRRKMAEVLEQVVSQREVRGVYLTIFLLAGGAALLDPYVPVSLDRLHGGDSAAFVGVTMAVFGFLAGGCTPLAGRLADRFGRATVLGWSLVALAAVSAGMALAPNSGVFAGLQALRGIPHAATVGLMYPLVALVVAPHLRGGLMAGVSLPRNVAGFLAPLLGAAIAPLGLPTIFAIAAVTYLGGWLMLNRTLPRRAQPDAGRLQPARRDDGG